MLSSSVKKAVQYYLIAAGVILIDQIVKILIKTNMRYGEDILLLGKNRPAFRLHFLENDGAAFGITVDDLINLFGGAMGQDTGKMILSLFSILAVSVIGVVLYRAADHKSPLPLFISLIFGGAIGNIIDRVFYGMWFTHLNAPDYPHKLFYGRVVDMFYFDVWEGTLPLWIPKFGGIDMSLFPVFNVADAAISVGILTILIFQKRFFDQHDKKTTVEEKIQPQVTAISEPDTEIVSQDTESAAN
ncbi:MAG: signal peptidase II [Bacteroidia bacterium]